MAPTESEAPSIRIVHGGKRSRVDEREVTELHVDRARAQADHGGFTETAFYKVKCKASVRQSFLDWFWAKGFAALPSLATSS